MKCHYAGFQLPVLHVCVRVSTRIVPDNQGSCRQGQGRGQISEFPTAPGRGNCLLISALPSATGTCPPCLSSSRPCFSSSSFVGPTQGSETTCNPGWRAAGHRIRWRLDGKHAPSPHARCTQTGAPDWMVSPVATHPAWSLPKMMASPASTQLRNKEGSMNGRLPQSRTASS